MENVKIVYLFTAITWYRMELFKSISKEADLSVYILNDAPKGYNTIEYSPDLKRFPFKVSLLTKEESRFKNLITILDKEDFDAIVIPSMNSVSYLLLSTKLADYYSRKKKKVLYFWEYWPMEKDRSSLGKKIKEGVRHLFVRINQRKINKFIVPSINTFAFYRKLGIPSRKLIRCVNASEIDIDTYQYNQPDMRSKMGIKPQQKVILFFGRLENYKGVGELIKAFKRVYKESWELVICGPGNEYFDNDNCDHIHFTGSIRPEERYLYYSMADIFVLPNTYKNKVEPWGLTVNEAMSFGIPVLVSDATGSGRDLVFPGINGYIMDSLNLEVELQYYLEKLLEDDANLAVLGENAKKVISIYTFDNMAKSFITAADH